MVNISNYAEKEGSRFRRGRSWKINLFGAHSDVSSPELQAFRLDLCADQVLDAHFHIVDQFQVFIDGKGTIGRDNATVISAHYADHHTGYGPLVAGEQGLTYLTLRSKTDAGLVFLREPRVREKLQPTKRRHYMSAQATLSTEPVLAARESVAVEDLLEQHDGDEAIAVKLIRMGPGMTTQAPETADSGGEYVIVLNGSLELEGQSLRRYSLVFIRSSEEPPVLTAGPQGLEVMVTRFPIESPWMASI